MDHELHLPESVRRHTKEAITGIPPVFLTWNDRRLMSLGDVLDPEVEDTKL